ncbi:MAG: hypothetical protein SGJ19_09455 [Planctomycetia bacterium]|nr:hypothetical protein [Planctomycetia bacterium]
MMLFPRYSLRWVLGGTALAGSALVVVRSATQGSAWAVGVTAGMAGLAVFLAVYAWLFFLVWLVSALLRTLTRSRTPEGRSPFAPLNP